MTQNLFEHTIFSGPNIFSDFEFNWTENFFYGPYTQITFWSHFFGPKINLEFKFFSDPNFLKTQVFFSDPIYFGPKIFKDPKNLLTQICYDPNFIFDKKFFLTQNFFDAQFHAFDTSSQAYSKSYPSWTLKTYILLGFFVKKN